MDPTEASHATQYLQQFLGPDTGQLQQAIEACAELVRLGSGTTLFRQGDPADCMYLVVRGRLRVVDESPGQAERVVNEVPAGQSVGEMALFTRDARTATVVAIRDSLLVKLNREDFDAISEQYPSFALKLSRQVIGRLSRSMAEGPARVEAAINIAVLPRTENTDLNLFTDQLCTALKRFGKVLYLRAEATPTDHRANLAGWLDDQEMHHDFIVLQGDNEHAHWSNKAAQHADKVLLVGDASAETHPELLPAYLGENRIVERHWVFMHQPERRQPENTAAAMKGQLVHHWHHLTYGDQGDTARLARILSGNAIALVLSGGGARGMAHIGVLKALEEANIPIDLVGGTSIGSAVAALIAMGLPADEISSACHQGFVVDKPLNDYTLPFSALLAGRKMDHACQHYFPAEDIEDLWLSYFCVSADLAQSGTVIHEHGVLWKALRASMSLPGIFPPVVHNDHLLIDGAAVNNLPVDIMANRVKGKIIAVDLDASERIFQLQANNFPSTARQLRQRLLPWLKQKSADAPSVFEIVTKAALISSEQKRLENQQLADLYLNPPLAEFSLLEFDDFDRILKAGYDYTKGELEKSHNLGLLGH